MENNKLIESIEKREKKYCNNNNYERLGCKNSDGWNYNLLMTDKKNNEILIICKCCWKVKFKIGLDKDNNFCFLLNKKGKR